MAGPHQSPLYPPPQQKSDLNLRLQEVWERNLPVLRGRLDLLSAAAGAAQGHNLSDPFRAEAIAVAHKLAGSLGMFGYPESTNLALRLEAAFSSTASDPDTLTRLADELRASLHLSHG